MFSFNDNEEVGVFKHKELPFKDEIEAIYLTGDKEDQFQFYGTPSKEKFKANTGERNELKNNLQGFDEKVEGKCRRCIPLSQEYLL